MRRRRQWVDRRPRWWYAGHSLVVSSRPSGDVGRTGLNNGYGRVNIHWFGFWTSVCTAINLRRRGAPCIRSDALDNLRTRDTSRNFSTGTDCKFCVAHLSIAALIDVCGVFDLSAEVGVVPLTWALGAEGTGVARAGFGLRASDCDADELDALGRAGVRGFSGGAEVAVSLVAGAGVAG